MDYKKLKDEIKEITEVACSVPEPFRERCFQILLEYLLARETTPTRVAGVAGPASETTVTVERGKIPTPAQVRVFMQKTGVTEDDLNSVLLYEDGQVHFIREPAPTKISRGQMEWALLLVLKNAIVSNNLSVDPEDVRSICQEKGFYDGPNFAKNFKQPKNAALFKKPLEPQGEPQALSAEGLQELGRLVKALAGTD